MLVKYLIEGIATLVIISKPDKNRVKVVFRPWGTSQEFRVYLYTR
jgi:hypothetical protein